MDVSNGTNEAIMTLIDTYLKAIFALTLATVSATTTVVAQQADKVAYYGVSTAQPQGRSDSQKTDFRLARHSDDGLREEMNVSSSEGAKARPTFVLSDGEETFHIVVSSLISHPRACLIVSVSDPSDEENSDTPFSWNLRRRTR